MAIEDLRKKLKPVSVAVMEGQDKKLNDTLGIKEYSGRDGHKIEDGRNLFRIYPPHEPVDENGIANPFAEPKVITYLPAMVADKDKDGNFLKDGDKVRLKLGVKPVFNSKVHGKLDSKRNPLTKDLVEEFIRIANEKAKTLTSKEEKERFLLPIYGAYSPDPKLRVNGIVYQPKWEVYADKIKGDQSIGYTSVFKPLEIGKAVKNRMNVISAMESANEPLGTDPYTDLDEGRAVVIVYKKDATDPKDYYTTEIDTATVEVEVMGGKKGKILRTFPITDDQLEVFAKAKPLTEVYRNVFKRSDLDTQLTGLKMLDEKYKMGIVETEEFQAIAEELMEQYPAEVKKGEETSQESSSDDEPMTTSTTTLPVTTKTTTVGVRTDLPFDEDKDEFSDYTRDDLKEYNKDNNCGILVKPASQYTDEQFREDLRTWVRSQNVKANTETTIPEVDSATKHLGPETDKLNEVETKAPLSAKEKLELLKKKNTVV